MWQALHHFARSSLARRSSSDVVYRKNPFPKIFPQVTVDLQINNSDSPQARYLTWAPSPCRIRLTDPSGASTPVVNVTLTGRSGATGGAVVFRKTATGSSSTSLSLQLPIDGASVPFFVLGRFGQPSVSDGDVDIEVRDGTTVIEPGARNGANTKERQHVDASRTGSFPVGLRTVKRSGSRTLRRFS